MHLVHCDAIITIDVEKVDQQIKINVISVLKENIFYNLWQENDA